MGMDAGELVAKILVAISSGRDLYVYDRYIIGPNAKQRAREVLIERRDACSDPDRMAFLTSVIPVSYTHLLRGSSSTTIWRGPGAPMN